jgi:apolipoprotein D and lipocalin family protein
LSAGLASLLPFMRRRRDFPLPNPDVELARFMGAWYVLGGILTPLERCVANAVEYYELDDDGTVAARFRFRAGGFDGPFMEFTSRGYPTDDPSNAVWGMEFVPPLRLDYRIAHVDADYRVTLVGRERRDLLWIMARTPSVPDAVFGDLVARAEAMGYDPDAIFTVPQRWDDMASTPA